MRVNEGPTMSFDMCCRLRHIGIVRRPNAILATENDNFNITRSINTLVHTCLPESNRFPSSAQT